MQKHAFSRAWRRLRVLMAHCVAYVCCDLAIVIIGLVLVLRHSNENRSIEVYSSNDQGTYILTRWSLSYLETSVSLLLYLISYWEMSYQGHLPCRYVHHSEITRMTTKLTLRHILSRS